MNLVMADQGNSNVLRDYRKGNWTIHETMVLIAAKKMDEERRMKKSGEKEVRSRPAELRWKWVEDYCWRNGCLRSQNQCNDKWDNLMRDYKKVRDHERRLAEKGGGDEGSYWKLDKHERKDRNLPSNMLSQIYEALVEVVERRVAQRASGSSDSHIGFLVERPMSIVQHPLPPLLEHHSSTPIPALAPPPPPPPTLPHSQPLPTMCDSSDSDTSEYSGSPAKRRRRGEGTSRSSETSLEVGSAISKSASIIAEALQACEEKEEKRHRDLLSVQERRLKIEESRTEINREAINGMVDAVNKLANSILALVSEKNQTAPQ
ncbi:hypothetical protein HHK36_023228 [Tetracentron sinense]|uniref:Myb-like domain-containing protein n=1 Tax=Tetracentron sinense TaxID=13715 RepID=A0A835D579_TETSI|nr:hypothetical protein HHK36_023228 [Tetracentron sinense]